MNTSRLVKAIAIAIIPITFFGCAKKEADKSQVKKPGDEKTVVSDNLTNFSGLSDMIKNEKIADDEIICTVGDDAINVGDYKLEFRFKQDQAREILKNNPEEQKRLLADAMHMGISLTDREKKEFVEAAIEKGGEDLQKKFASGEIDKAKFTQSVLDMGVVLKAVNTAIEKQLLTELINDSLLLNAARKAGLGKLAFNRYVEIKHSKNFEKYMNSSTLTPNQVKDQVIEKLLIDMMKEKIREKAVISDRDLYEFYKTNKNNFKHEGRVKWSQIFIEEPERDFQAITSVETKVEREFPKLSDREKKAKIKELKEERKNLAMELVKRARAGEEFKTLANKYTEDPAARAAQKGGLMGYADLNEMSRNQIFNNVVGALETMQPGEIYPKPVKSIVGWHIVKLEEKQTAGYLPFEEVKDVIRQTLVAQHADLALRTWLIEKRNTVPVKISKRFESFFSENNKLPTDKTKMPPSETKPVEKKTSETNRVEPEQAETRSSDSKTGNKDE